jgi:hypothetical protein
MQSATVPNPNPIAHVWPMEHPVIAALLWALAIVVVAAPLAVYLFRRRTVR